MSIPTIKLSQKFTDKAISSLAGAVSGGGIATSIALASRAENSAFYLLMTPAFLGSMYLAKKQTEDFDFRSYLYGALAVMVLAVGKVEYDIYTTQDQVANNATIQMKNPAIN